MSCCIIYTDLSFCPILTNGKSHQTEHHGLVLADLAFNQLMGLETDFVYVDGQQVESYPYLLQCQW